MSMYGKNHHNIVISLQLKLIKKIAGRNNINNLRYPDDTTLVAESKEELKSFLMKVIEESEKADLKHLKH